MRDALAGSQVIRIPVGAHRQLAAVRRAEDELARLAAGPASTASVAERTGLSGERVRALRSAARATVSLDEQVREDGTSLGELVADEDANDPCDLLIAEEQAQTIWRMLRLLPPRHRAVVTRRYGIGGQPPQTHEQISAGLGIGQERSRQLEHEALQRLRSVAVGLAA
jgi:DNA-directed RNA polymerase sigma subunit (sigma70/sigma32)